VVGLPSSRAVALIRDELTPVDVAGTAGYRLGDVEPDRCLRLLAGYDNYLVGYRRRPFVPTDRYAEVYIGGVIRPTVLLDGAVVGRWSLPPTRRVEVELFGTLPAVARRLLDAEIADVEAFSSTGRTSPRTPGRARPARASSAAGRAATRAPATPRPPR
jgi:hypothetical protein